MVESCVDLYANLSSIKIKSPRQSSQESYLSSSSVSLTESTSDSEADCGVTGGPVQPLIPVRATRTRRLRGGTRRRRWPKLLPCLNHDLNRRFIQSLFPRPRVQLGIIRIVKWILFWCNNVELPLVLNSLSGR